MSVETPATPAQDARRWRTLWLLSTATLFSLTVWFSTNAIAPALEVAVERNSNVVPRETSTQRLMDWEPAQHCVTVASVNEAARIVEALQIATRGLFSAGFAVGGLTGSLIVALLWLLS